MPSSPRALVGAMSESVFIVCTQQTLRPLFLVWITIAVFLAGCAEPLPQVYIPDAIRVQSAILLSELQTASDQKQLIDSGFRIENNSSEPVRIRFDGTGCSCYGLYHQGRKLAPGEILDVPSGAAEIVSIEAKLPLEPGKHRFRANLTWLDGEREWDLPIELTVPLFSDVTVTPTVVVQEIGKSNDVSRIPVEVIHTSRDYDVAKQPPVVSGLPTGFFAEDWSTSSQPTELELSVWQSTWKSAISRQNPEPNDSLNEGNTQVRFSFETSGELASSAILRLIIRQTTGLRAPQRIMLGRTELGETQSRRVLVSSTDDVPFVIQSATSDSQQLQLDANSDIPNLHQWVTIHFTGTESGRFSSTAIITTDHPETSQIQFDVSAVVRQPPPPGQDK